jgi:hypothetical protein
MPVEAVLPDSAVIREVGVGGAVPVKAVLVHAVAVEAVLPDSAVIREVGVGGAVPVKAVLVQAVPI